MRIFLSLKICRRSLKPVCPGLLPVARVLPGRDAALYRLVWGALPYRMPLRWAPVCPAERSASLPQKNDCPKMPEMSPRSKSAHGRRPVGGCSGNRLQSGQKTAACTGPLFCRLKWGKNAPVSKNMPKKREFSWAWTTFPLENARFLLSSRVVIQVSVGEICVGEGHSQSPLCGG